MKKLTKAQARKRMNEIVSKAFKLTHGGYISIKDYEQVLKIEKKLIQRIR